ncbi:MAG: Stealth CR1 domain-containing protein [Clostridia bacterium]|nr:Stealth CR1 domain-containing protein [Clostridia bacterium]
MNKPIDFVVLWVDCNDAEWQKEKRKYSGVSEVDNSVIRYQDWENLKYWFRSVEKYAPWVNCVHLVTNGQVPEWLNTECPKLNLVKHSDYMPSAALPTFNSNAIEVGICDIPALSKCFVLFNDDMFLTAPVSEEYYFKNGVPVDMVGFISAPQINHDNVFSFLMKNNNDVIFSHFTRKEIVTDNVMMWFRPWYGKTFLRSLIYALKKGRVGFVIPHLSTPYLKTDFKRVWDKEEEKMRATQHNRFRSKTDLTHFLFRNWRMSLGEFVPRKSKGKYFSVENTDDAKKIASAILKNKYPEICINEQCSGETFEEIKKIVNSAFEQKLPQKSMFER